LEEEHVRGRGPLLSGSLRRQAGETRDLQLS
jgi:hypothetical protein